MLRQKQPLVISNENESGDVKQHIRPVSMYETREGIKCDTIRNIQVSNSQYCINCALNIKFQNL